MLKINRYINHYITENIVSNIQEKTAWQFIFSTRNANIPVFGNAKLIFSLSPPERGEHGRVQAQKSHLSLIDNIAVRKLVEQILEDDEKVFDIGAGIRILAVNLPS